MGQETLRWWAVCEPCQQPLAWNGPPPSAGGDKGEWWASTEELFHCGHPATGFA